MVVCPLAVRRCLYGYFADKQLADIPHMELGNEEIIELTITPAGMLENIIQMGTYASA